MEHVKEPDLQDPAPLLRPFNRLAILRPEPIAVSYLLDSDWQHRAAPGV